MRVVTSYEEIPHERVVPGQEVLCCWVRARHADGKIEEREALYFLCPVCGTVGYAPRAREGREGVAWEISEVAGKLTMSPSIDCTSTARRDGPQGRCPGHFWMRSGVLEEV